MNPGKPMAIDFRYLEELVGGKESSMSFADAAEFFGAKGLRYEIEERAAILTTRRRVEAGRRREAGRGRNDKKDKVLS